MRRTVTLASFALLAADLPAQEASDSVTSASPQRRCIIAEFAAEGFVYRTNGSDSTRGLLTRRLTGVDANGRADPTRSRTETISVRLGGPGPSIASEGVTILVQEGGRKRVREADVAVLEREVRTLMLDAAERCMR